MRKGENHMRIVTLMDDRELSAEFQASHGLSFYIETKNHKILFDMGADESFLLNAQRLGVDIAGVDIAFLSHGHYDHGGGLKAFFEANSKASVHMQKKAFGAFYAHDPDGKIRYIGLPEEMKEHPRIVFHTGDYKIDAGIQVFAGVTGRECYSPANDRLFQDMNGHHIQDLFMHEQNLLLKEGNKIVLIAGCAHNGIVNILKKAQTFTPKGIDAVIGGMHLKNAYTDEKELENFCQGLAARLLDTGCDYYTCHCTGTEAYELLRKEMKGKIQYLAAGSELVIE